MKRWNNFMDQSEDEDSCAQCVITTVSDNDSLILHENLPFGQDTVKVIEKITIILENDGKYQELSSSEDVIQITELKIKEETDNDNSSSAKPGALYLCYLCDYEATTKNGLKQHFSSHNLFPSNINSVGNASDEAEASFKNDKTSPDEMPIIWIKQKELSDNHTITKQEENQYDYSSLLTEARQKDELNCPSIKDENDKYNCTQCSYKTTISQLFLKHCQSHRKKGYLFEQERREFDIDVQKNDIYLKHGDSTNASDNFSDYDTRQTFSVQEKLHKENNDPTYDFVNSENHSGKVIAMYKCRECDYETKCKSNFVRHCGAHDKGNVTIHKCECGFKTISLNLMRKHQETQKNCLKDEQFACRVCSLKTDDEKKYLEHQASCGEVAGQVHIYSCSQCNYDTKRKDSFLSHCLSHMKNEDSASEEYVVRKSDVDMQINECSTNNNQIEIVVKDDMFEEQDDTTYAGDYFEDVDNCDTKRTFSIQDGLKEENDDPTYDFANSENHTVKVKVKSKYKCKQCDYDTKCKSNFVRHCRAHEERNVPIHKCECGFKTISFHRMRKHQSTRKNCRKYRKFTCPVCLLETADREKFVEHQASCREIAGQVHVYSCSQCDYNTKENEYFLKHSLSHLENGDSVLQQQVLRQSDVDMQINEYLTDNNQIDIVVKDDMYEEQDDTTYAGDDFEDVDNCDTKQVFSMQDSLKEADDDPDYDFANSENHTVTVKVKIKYKCKKCDYDTKCKSNFVRHCRAHEERGVPIHECECGFKTISFNLMRKHQKTRKNCHKDDVCSLDTANGDSVPPEHDVRQPDVDIQINECSIDNTKIEIAGKDDQLEDDTYICDDSEDFDNCDTKQGVSVQDSLNEESDDHSETENHSNDVKDTTYQCRQCDYTTNCNSNFKRHCHAHEKRKVPIRECQCGFKTISFNLMRKHQRTQKSCRKEEIFTCRICLLETIDEEIFLDHQSSCHEIAEQVNMHSCTQCDYSTRRKANYLRHCLYHKKRPKCYQCTCGYKTISKALLGKHKHRGTECDNVQKNENILPAKVYKCEKCHYQTSWRNNFRNHLRLHTICPTTYKCDSCHYTTVSRYKLKCHQVREKHIQPKPLLQCNYCEYQCFNQSRLNTHTLLHMDRADLVMYRCDTCSYETFRKRDLKIHYRIHLNADEVRQYLCDKCDYVTINRGNLTRHLVKKHGIGELRKLLCHKCDFTTANKSNLTYHLFSRHGFGEAENYYCDKCDYVSNKKDNLRQHLRKKHGCDPS